MYTLEPGRCIVRDGTPLAVLHGVGNYVPIEVDRLAHVIVDLLNGDRSSEHAKLIRSLGVYVSGDDVEIKTRSSFLRFVANRIQDDIRALEDEQARDAAEA
jgi:hypothetical protein